MGRIIRSVVNTLLPVVLSAVGFIFAGPLGAALGAGVGAFLGGKIAPRQRVSGGGVSTRLTLDPNAAQVLVVGETIAPAQLIYWGTEGSDNRFLSMIVAHAAVPITAYGALKLDDVDVALSNGAATSPDRWRALLTVQRHLGAGASAFTSVAPAGKWTSAHAGRGLALQHFRMTYDGRRSQTGIPQNVAQVVKGSAVYDPRRDSTVGGSGTMRASDQTTWAYSAGGVDIGRNPALVELTYRIGWRENGRVKAGMGEDPANIDYASYIYAANICAQDVGGRPRYTIDGVLSLLDDHNTNLSRIHECAGARPIDTGGLIGIWVAHDDTANVILDLTPDDFVDDLGWTPVPPVETRRNTATGTYADPTNSYQQRDYPPVEPAELLADDNGQALRDTLDFTMVTDVNQARALADLALRESRQGELTLTTNLRALGLRPADVVAVTHPRWNWDDKTFRIESWALQPQALRISMRLREIAAADYAPVQVVAVSTPAPPNTIGFLPPVIESAADLPGQIDYATQVGGDEKPENNATVGAPAGTLVGSIPAEWLHLGATDNVLFDDFTSYTDANEIVPSVWLRRDGSGELTVYGNSVIASGGKSLRIGNNSGNDEAWLVSARSIPFDPNATYRISAAIFQESGAGLVTIGVEGRAEDGITLVNRTGINTSGNQHNFAAQNVAPPIGQLTTYTGYFSGYGAPNATSGASPDIRNPGRVHANVRRIAPLIDLNYFQQSGVCYVDWVRLERLPDGYVETVVKAAEATDRLIVLGSDGKIGQEEKAAFVREVNTLLTTADQTIIAATNVGLGAGSPTTNWASAVTVRKNSLTALLAGYTTPNLWSDTTGDTNVSAVNLEYALSDLNSYIAQAQAAISTRASTTSNWSGVNNDTGGKPEDYATNDRGADTRYDNFSPDYYRQFFPLRVRTEFKLRSVIGAPGTAQFGVLYTLAKWPDDSGGPVEQQFTSESGIFYRRGTNASGWGAWSTSFDTINRPDLSAGHLLNGGSQLAPGQLLNSSIVVNPDGTASFYNGAAWVNLGAVTISGLGYSGDLNATRGAPAGTVVGATAAETVSSRVARLRDNGRALGALLPSGNNAGVTSALLTAPVTGLTASSITISPHTRHIFGSAVYYNGGTISGLSPSTRYHIYADDPDELGGAVVYLATTDFSAISGVNRIYFGPVTTAAAGNPGGGGGGGGGDLPPKEFCVDVAMFVDHGLRAGGVRPGDSIWCMDDAGTPVGLRAITDAVDAVADCLRLTASNGAAVIVSCSAPLWTLNRGLIRARDAEPGDVVMTRVCQRDVLSGLTSVDPLGRRRVRKIHVEGISYAAGVDPAALIYTHNPTYKP